MAYNSAYYCNNTNSKIYEYDFDTSSVSQVGTKASFEAPIQYGDYLYFRGNESDSSKSVYRLSKTTGTLTKIGYTYTKLGVNAYGVYFGTNSGSALACIAHSNGAQTLLNNVNISNNSSLCLYRGIIYYVTSDRKLCAVSSNPKIYSTPNLGSISVNAYSRLIGTENTLFFMDANGYLKCMDLATLASNSIGNFKLWSPNSMCLYQGFIRLYAYDNINGTTSSYYILVETIGLQISKHLMNPRKGQHCLDNISCFSDLLVGVYSPEAQSGSKLYEANISSGIPKALGKNAKDTFAPNEFNQPSLTSITPKYQVTAVLYAPPASAVAPKSSGVIYSQTITVGTETSVTDTFSESYSTSASAKPTSSASLSIAVETADTNEISNSLSVTFGSGYTYSLSQPTVAASSTTGTSNSNAINHDYDRFQLLLNPIVTATSDEYSSSVNWALGFSGDTAIIDVISVADITQNTAAATYLRENYNFTDYDFRQILKLNPFAIQSSPAIDPERYKILSQTVPFSPQTSSESPIGTASGYFETSNATTQISSFTVKTEQIVVVSGNISIFMAGATDKWTWTQKSTLQEKTATGQKSAYAITQPAYGYTGPQVVFVYLDTVFNTFLFDFRDAGIPAILSFSVDSNTGSHIEPIAMRPFVVTISWAVEANDNTQVSLSSTAFTTLFGLPLAGSLDMQLYESQTIELTAIEASGIKATASTYIEYTGP
jgi:hypothetical protein